VRFVLVCKLLTDTILRLFKLLGFEHISTSGLLLMIHPNAAGVFSLEILHIPPSRQSLSDKDFLVLFCLCAILPLGGLY